MLAWDSFKFLLKVNVYLGEMKDGLSRASNTLISLFRDYLAIDLIFAFFSSRFFKCLS